VAYAVVIVTGYTLFLPSQYDVIRPVTRGEKPPNKIFRPSPWKNVLSIVENYWTEFKKYGPLSENSSSPPLVSQAGYGPGRHIHICLQTNVLAKFDDTACILFYTHSLTILVVVQCVTVMNLNIISALPS